MRSTILRLAFFLFYFSIILPGFAQNQKVAAWVAENAIPLKTVVAENGFEDLMPLKSILEGKRVVAMGEATHGTREFFQMKHRMLEFLVSECGFDLFAIEANFQECLAINDYVMGGNGDAREALAGTYFWVWNTEEVLAMIEWMRKWNLGHPSRKVMFTGFDMQFTPESAKVVAGFLKEHAPTLYGKHRDNLDGMAKQKFIFQAPDSLIVKWKESAIEIDRELRREDIEWGVGENALKMVQMNARICHQATMGAGRNGRPVRDSCMAENTRFILEEMGGENSKIMLWAHNGHIREKAYDHGLKSQGVHLAEMYGDEMYTIGFDFEKGSFCAWCMGNFSEWTAEAPKKGSLGKIFQEVPLDRFFIDFQTAQKNPVMAKFLSQKVLQRSVGAIYHPGFAANFYLRSPLAEMYDGMIFLKSTTMANNLKGEDQYVATVRQIIKGKIKENMPVRLSAKVKLDGATPTSMAHLLFGDRIASFSYSTTNTTKSDTLRNHDWQAVSVSGTRGNTALFEIGLTIQGKGTVLLDDLKLEYQVGGIWLEYPLENPGFEDGDTKAALKTWEFNNEIYTLSIGTTDAADGKYCLTIAWKGPSQGE